MVAKLRGWQAQIKETLRESKSRPNELDSAMWAGMAVSPDSFSRQLGEMQVSLQRANTPQTLERGFEQMDSGQAGAGRMVASSIEGD